MQTIVCLWVRVCQSSAGKSFYRLPTSILISKLMLCSPTFAYLVCHCRRVRSKTCPWSVAILYLLVSSVLDKGGFLLCISTETRVLSLNFGGDVSESIRVDPSYHALVVRPSPSVRMDCIYRAYVVRLNVVKSYLRPHGLYRAYVVRLDVVKSYPPRVHVYSSIIYMASTSGTLALVLLP